MRLVKCRDGNRQNPAANHLPPEPQQSFAGNVGRMTAVTSGKAADPDPSIRYRELEIPDRFSSKMEICHERRL